MQQLEKTLLQITPCEVTQCQNVREALQLISSHPPDLIITEWVLQDHSADNLLRALKSRKEWETIPVLVGASTRSQELKLKAKMLGAYDYLIKPLNAQLLKWYLEMLFPTASPLPSFTKRHEEETASTRQDIRPHLSAIQSLAPLPTLAQTILDIGNDPNASASDLRMVIEKDQSLTAKILKTVNSAYYGFHRKIGNIDRAIVILGFNEIMNLTLAACIMNTYPEPQDVKGFQRKRFWVHALGCAYIARGLATLQSEVSSKDAFVIGLLHDFGKVVLDQHFHRLFVQILEAAASQNRPLHQVSTEIAGIDHAEIGGLVAEYWKLPATLATAIHYHHAPDLAHAHAQAVALAHISNYYCHKFEIGNSGNPVLEEPFDLSLEALGMERKSLGEVWFSLKINPELIQSVI